MPNDIIEIGDEVRFVYNDSRFHGAVLGYVGQHIKDQCDEPGLELLLSDEPGLVTVRIWLSSGVVEKTGHVAPWKPKSVVEEIAKVMEVVPVMPYKHPSDLAAIYRLRGLSLQNAWKEFIKDTVLQKQYRSEAWDFKDFSAVYN